MRLCTLYTIIISSTLCKSVKIGSAAQFSKFRVLNKETETICTKYQIEWERSTPSVSSCVKMCSTHSPCDGIIYKDDEDICYGLQREQGTDGCSTKTSGGVIYWKLPDTCPLGWKGISVWCYKIIDLNDWQSASELCKSYSEVSHLAYVHTNEEYAAIKTWLKSIGQEHRTWIEGYRINNTDDWTWEDGVEIPVSEDIPWGGNEPDNQYPADCMIILSIAYKFGDTDCTYNLPGLCELDIYN